MKYNVKFVLHQYQKSKPAANETITQKFGLHHFKKNLPSMNSKTASRRTGDFIVDVQKTKQDFTIFTRLLGEITAK
jgi:hypothetical protein